MFHKDFRLIHLLKHVLCAGSVLALGISLCGCSATPSVEDQTKKPNIGIQPQIPVPDQPFIATRPIKGVSQTPVNEVVVRPTVSDSKRSIYFPPRLASVDSEGKEKLRGCADILKRNTKKVVVLVGYSDDLGSKSYNLAIAEQRITAISLVLRSLGIQSTQIRRNRSNSVKGPARPCRSEECRRQMSRVEFVCGV